MLLSLLGACGRHERPTKEPASALEELFQKGRRHSFLPKQALESFALVQNTGEVHAVEQLDRNPAASWVRFDTRLMPDIAQETVRDQLPRVLQRYGAMLGHLQAQEWMPAERFERRDESRLFLNYSRQVGGLPVRDNVLQLVLVQTAPGLYRLSELQSNVSGPAPRWEAGDAEQAEAKLKEATLDNAWLEDLCGRSDIVLEKTWLEWVTFPDDESFDWKKAVVYEWMMDGEHYRATLLPDEALWLDAWPFAVHAKPILTRALKRSYAEDGPRAYPLSFSAANGASGNFELGAEAWLPQGFTPASVGLSGPRAMIFDNHAVDSLTYAGIQEEEQSFFLPDDPTRLAGVNAFVAVQRINRFARQFLSSDEAPFLGQALVVNVNLTEQTCNAFYSPKQQRLLLYKEGDGCANMALLNDVIYHEWGHALDDHVGRSPGIRDSAFSEGLADVVAAFYNNDPAIAPYFVFDDPSPLRSLTETRIYPRDQGAIHFEGGIIASTFWELRQLLIERYGYNRGAHLAGRLFFRHLLAVDSYLESYAAVLRIDDDDNNPATPGPNHCLINSVFARHGLATDERCEDPPLALSRAATELRLALLDAGPQENAVHVLASAPAAEGMALCLGGRARCESDRRLWVPLQAVDAHAERPFFKSTAPILLPSLTLVTLMRLDASGQLLDSRELKIFAK